MQTILLAKRCPGPAPCHPTPSLFAGQCCRFPPSAFSCAGGARGGKGERCSVINLFQCKRAGCWSLCSDVNLVLNYQQRWALFNMSGRKKEGRQRAAQTPKQWVVQKRMVSDETLSLSHFEPGVNSSQATAVSAFPKCHCKEVFAQHKPHLSSLPLVLWSHFLRTCGIQSSYHYCSIQISISHPQIPDLSRAAHFSMGSSSFPASFPRCCSRSCFHYTLTSPLAGCSPSPAAGLNQFQ